MSFPFALKLAVCLADEATRSSLECYCAPQSLDVWVEPLLLAPPDLVWFVLASWLKLHLWLTWLAGSGRGRLWTCQRNLQPQIPGKCVQRSPKPACVLWHLPRVRTLHFPGPLLNLKQKALGEPNVSFKIPCIVSTRKLKKKIAKNINTHFLSCNLRVLIVDFQFLTKQGYYR